MDNGNIKRRFSGHTDLFEQIVSLENLLAAWHEFKKGKTTKEDVQQFEFDLENNLFALHHRLKTQTWSPDPYVSFYIRDPRVRHIHKATIRDRVFNQALFRVLYPIFDPTFIHDSYSCRIGKGTHRGVLRLDTLIRRVTSNHTQHAYALKCDVKKFFASVSHDILLTIIKRTVSDERVLALIRAVIESFQDAPGKGLPLGNVTSQLFANVYLNDLDQFMKHQLKARQYLRYCDDFVILSTDKKYLLSLVPPISDFLEESLGLSLHPEKIILRKTSQGVDFLGYIALPHYRVLRTSTKNRMLRKIVLCNRAYREGQVSAETFESTLHSYLGMLTHCSGYKVRKTIFKLLYGDNPPHTLA